MGVMIAPVAGSGSCPAWMQRVGKRASGVSFTAAIVPLYRVAPPRRETLDMIQPDHATSLVIHVLPTRSAADGPGVAAAGAAAPLPAGDRGRPRAGPRRLAAPPAAPVAGACS